MLTSGRRARGWVLGGDPGRRGRGAAVRRRRRPASSSVVLAVLPGAAVGLAAPRPWRPPDAVALGADRGCRHRARGARRRRSRLVTRRRCRRRRRHRADDDVRGPGAQPEPTGVGLPVAALVASAALIAWTGANDPRVDWFGPTIWHGPRDSDEVAITFDDGPNACRHARHPRHPRPLRREGHVLPRRQGPRRPTRRSAQALLDDGMLLGGHSYHHDYWRWLDPRYPELQRTIDAFKRHLGVCPHLLPPAARPAHAVHEPAAAQPRHGVGDVGRVSRRLGN